MQYYPFDSRNSLYKSKFGAVAEGESLRLRILLHRDAKVHNAYLVIKKDDGTYANVNSGEVSVRGIYGEDYV